MFCCLWSLFSLPVFLWQLYRLSANYKKICRNYLIIHIPDDEIMFQFSLLIIIYIPEEMLLMNWIFDQNYCERLLDFKIFDYLLFTNLWLCLEICCAEIFLSWNRRCINFFFLKNYDQIFIFSFFNFDRGTSVVP